MSCFCYSTFYSLFIILISAVNWISVTTEVKRQASKGENTMLSTPTVFFLFQKYCHINDRNIVWSFSQGLHKWEVHIFLVSVCSPTRFVDCLAIWEHNPASQCSRHCTPNKVNAFGTGKMLPSCSDMNKAVARLLNTPVCSVTNLRCQYVCVCLLM